MNISWNAEDYEKGFSFVHEYGESVLGLIPEGLTGLAVDLGCGSGALTGRLKERGFETVGIDASEDMLQKARRDHPDLAFMQADALDFSLPKKADLIFSNAVFHWIDAARQKDLARNIADNLKKGGYLVTEFGGFGCVETIHAALEAEFKKEGLIYPRPMYFPTIGQYAPILEEQGLTVEYAVLFDRPTPQKGEEGLASWIGMFVKKPFENMDEDMKERLTRRAVAACKEKLMHKGTWYADYVRIRVRAAKTA